MVKPKIPASVFNSIITTNYPKAKGNVKLFFDSCFADIIAKAKITDYQSRAQATGEMFEHAFEYLIKRHGVILQKDIKIKAACMMGAGALDFGIVRESKILCGIEAKGSSSVVSVRPALKRTDTAKKAIAQAYQFKRIYPEIPFYVVTNVMPTAGNAKCMLDLAKGNIIDDVVDLTDSKQLNTFVATLKAI